MLDIHQIITGRGNAAFMIFPDGTLLRSTRVPRATQNTIAYLVTNVDQRSDAS